MRQIEAVVRRIFPTTSLTVEWVTEGGSTFVYRIATEGETFYLRVWPEEGESFAPEVAVHAHLRQRQLKVPEVIYFELCNDLLQRSLAMTTEIKGQPLIQSSTLSKFAFEYWEADFAYLVKSFLCSSEVEMLERVVSQYARYLCMEHAYPAHGDFDATHIFHAGRRYTGIIDFGEIRGTDHWYDLGYFHLHDGEQLPYWLEAALVRGYGEIMPLPSDYEQRICFTSVLMNVLTLAQASKAAAQSAHAAPGGSAAGGPGLPSLYRLELGTLENGMCESVPHNS